MPLNVLEQKIQLKEVLHLIGWVFIETPAVLTHSLTMWKQAMGCIDGGSIKAAAKEMNQLNFLQQEI